MDPLINGANDILIMVSRPRISENELVPVMKAVFHQLEHDLDEGFSEDSKHLFRVLWRFHWRRPGPPSYPEFNKDNLIGLLYALIEDFQGA